MYFVVTMKYKVEAGKLDLERIKSTDIWFMSKQDDLFIFVFL